MRPFAAAGYRPAGQNRILVLIAVNAPPLCFSLLQPGRWPWLESQNRFAAKGTKNAQHLVRRSGDGVTGQRLLGHDEIGEIMAEGQVPQIAGADADLFPQQAGGM